VTVNLTLDTWLPPRLRAALSDAARDGEGFVVGGYARDRLLGRAAADLDVAVSTDPRLVANRLASQLGGAVFALSAEHRAWRLTLDAPVDGVSHVDVARLRGDIEADLRLRDFTINAIALPLDGGGLIDPTGGRADLERGALRLVTDHAIHDDPLRALRAVRHAVELGFELTPETTAVVRRDATLVRRSAGERQRDELMRAFDTPRAAAAARLLDGLGLLDVVLPELTPARGCEQPKEHYWDVLDHSIETVAVLDDLLHGHAPGRPRLEPLQAWWPPERVAATFWDAPVGEGRSRRALLKLTGLLHDVAKPTTKALQPDGRMRFFGHPEQGAVLAGAALRRLRFSGREQRQVELLIREHLRPGQLASPGEPPTARALYRFYRDLGDAVPDLLMLNLADGAAAAGPRQTAEQWTAHVAYTAWLLRQPTEREALVRPARLVSGHDLIAELGLAPGPALGRLLDGLAEAEAAGEVTTRAAALDRARELLQSGL
jgi:poly(A) polymerase